MRRTLGLLLIAPLAGCFALFTLDEYGTAGPEQVDGGLDAPIDVPIIEAASDMQVPPLPTGKIVFVTETEYAAGKNNDGMGELGNVQNANALCMQAAAKAKLTGQFLAWISDSQRSPSTTFAAMLDAGTPTQLITPDHRIIAASYAELTDSGPRVAIAVTETNVHLPEGVPRDGGGGVCPDGGLVWTGTGAAGGNANNDDCDSWTAGGNAKTGRAGQTVKHRNDWTNICSLTCSMKARLYCFEQ